MVGLQPNDTLFTVDSCHSIEYETHKLLKNFDDFIEFSHMLTC